MINRKKSLIGLSVLLVVVLCGNFAFYLTKSNIQKYLQPNPKKIKIAGYWNLIETPIYIDDMSPYDNWETIASFNPWCTGKGTALEPYIIQDVVVSSTDSDCIEIRNSNVYFIITNCIIFSSQKELGKGVFLQNVKHGKIMTSQISNCESDGITISDCADIVVYQNTIYDNGWMGVSLFKGVNCEIYGNTIYNNSVIGIQVGNSNNTKIEGNDIYSNDRTGVFITHSTYSNIQSNNLYNNREQGFELIFCKYALISHNILTDNTQYGILLQYSSNYNTITMNTISGSTYCIVLDRSCIGNQISNNGNCNPFWIEDPDPDPPDDTTEGNIAVSGFSIWYLLGFAVIPMIVIVLKSKRKKNLIWR